MMMMMMMASVGIGETCPEGGQKGPRLEVEEYLDQKQVYGKAVALKDFHWTSILALPSRSWEQNRPIELAHSVCECGGQCVGVVAAAAAAAVASVYADPRLVDDEAQFPFASYPDAVEDYEGSYCE